VEILFDMTAVSPLLRLMIVLLVVGDCGHSDVAIRKPFLTLESSSELLDSAVSLELPRAVLYLLKPFPCPASSSLAPLAAPSFSATAMATAATSVSGEP
jgi:hypothetical protein